MTNPRITLPRVPNLNIKNYEILEIYFDFCFNFGKTKKVKGWHRHHIHPTKLGGKDIPENYRWLRPDIHFASHWILQDAISHQVVQRASWYLGQYSSISSEVYKILKEDYIVSDETRKKLSESGKGRVFSEESKIKISKSNKETYYNTDKEILQERIDKISSTKKGVPWNENHRQNIIPNFPRGKDHWRLKDDPLWERANEIHKLWVGLGKPKNQIHKRFCKLLNIPLTKKALTIAKCVENDIVRADENRNHQK